MNQRRHAKAFPLVATLVTIALAICFVTFAVKALMVKYQVLQGGSKIKQLEHEVAALAVNNQALLAEKAQLTSATELKKKFLAGFFKDLLVIKDNAVIPVGRVAAAKPPSDLPTASRLPEAAVAAANVTVGREGGR